MEKSIGLYIHVPFCKSKCYYCDFNSFSNKSELVEAYFEALKKEIIIYGERAEGYEVKTVFIGGGTPSSVDSRYIEDVVRLCRQHFKIAADAEISLESNPGTLSEDKLRAYKYIGINRLSIGLQAWQNRLLKNIGRVHSIEEFVDNYKLAREIGFNNINIDMIFSLPHQTLEDWAETVNNVADLGPEHISCYSLKIEENTVFWEKYEHGEIDEIDDHTDREMYYLAKRQLAGHGYGMYEISNFALEGYECKHNLIYWKAKEYLGLGAGAHSYFNKKRYNNLYNIEDYIKNYMEYEGKYIEGEAIIDEAESMSEYIILGMRLTCGISQSEFKGRYGIEIMDKFGGKFKKLIGKGLVEHKAGRLLLTQTGLDYANQVFMEFIDID
ncbi:MAG TPA: radical SAM family heme chaperone HemW [Pseudobacteroides sp.]|uniref:radical SAM family heme chaperone HemW n=1 Tax=Pseudobacteroides sp. TaxID=1968840 RepID=UPI002F95A309